MKTLAIFGIILCSLYLYFMGIRKSGFFRRKELKQIQLFPPMTIYKFTARFGPPPDLQSKTGWIVLKDHHNERFIRAMMSGSLCTIAEIIRCEGGFVLKLIVTDPYQTVTDCNLDPCFVLGERVEFSKNSRAYRIGDMPIEPFNVGDLVFCPCAFVM